MIKQRVKSLAVSLPFLLTLAGSVALAHDGDDALATWYRGLETPEGSSCCNQRDCHPVQAYRNGPDGIEVKVEDQWVPVPPSIILNRADNPTGEPVLCYWLNDGKPEPRCFIRPAEG